MGWQGSTRGEFGCGTYHNENVQYNLEEKNEDRQRNSEKGCMPEHIKYTIYGKGIVIETVDFWCLNKQLMK